MVQRKQTWVSIASALPGKTPEQCKEGWLHVPWKWTPQQDTVLLHAYVSAIGERLARACDGHTLA